MARIAIAMFLFVSTLFAQDAALLRHFDYDQKAPLDIREVSVEQHGEAAIHDISYASPKGGRVPAYLVVPKGKGPFAAVIWGHWYQDGSEFLNRKEFLEEAVALAPSGVVSLLTDGPKARPGYVEPAGRWTNHRLHIECRRFSTCGRGRTSCWRAAMWMRSGWLMWGTVTMRRRARFWRGSTSDSGRLADGGEPVG